MLGLREKLDGSSGGYQVERMNVRWVFWGWGAKNVEQVENGVSKFVLAPPLYILLQSSHASCVDVVDSSLFQPPILENHHSK